MKNSALTLSVLSLVLLVACTPTNPPSARKTGQSSVDNKDSAAMMKQKEKQSAMMDESGVVGFAMEGGKMMIIGKDDESEIMMKKDIELKSGMKVMMDGKVMMADGNTMMLKEGDAVMMDGTVTTVEALELNEDEEAQENGDDAMMKKDEPDKSDVMIAIGEYRDNTASNLPASVITDGKTKVLYFFAAWCPTCKKANQTLTSWYADGKGLLTVYKINYDEEKALEQKYGVTYQHTFVKVDGQGNMIEKIQGPSDEELKRLLES